MKRRFVVIAALLACILLQGCSLGFLSGETPRKGTTRMVTQISVACVPEDASKARIYTESGKIQAVLDYLEGLKLLERNATGSDPYDGATRTITIQYSGGTSKTYYLVHEKFLREGDADWMYVEETPEVSLEEILQANSSDLLAAAD